MEMLKILLLVEIIALIVCVFGNIYIRLVLKESFDYRIYLIMMVIAFLGCIVSFFIVGPISEYLLI